MTTTMAMAAPLGAETSETVSATFVGQPFFQRGVLGEKGGARERGGSHQLSSNLRTPWRYAATTDQRHDLQHPIRKKTPARRRERRRTRTNERGREDSQRKYEARKAGIQLCDHPGAQRDALQERKSVMLMSRITAQK